MFAWDAGWAAHIGRSFEHRVPTAPEPVLPAGPPASGTSLLPWASSRATRRFGFVFVAPRPAALLYPEDVCRLAAYLGDARSISSLFFDRAHSLETQSYAPREMKTALLNADGFGMAWYTPAAPSPALYRTVMPLWADDNVRRIAPHLVTGCALANVRSATIGMPSQTSNVSPFVEGAYAFTHNGFIRDFGLVRRRLAEGIDDVRYRAITGNTDSEHLFGCVMTELGRAPEDLAGALRRTVGRVRDLGVTALLNLILTDGRRVVALRTAIEGEAPTLYVHREPGGVLLASEPLEDAGFEPMAVHTLLEIAGGEVLSHPL